MNYGFFFYDHVIDFKFACHGSEENKKGPRELRRQWQEGEREKEGEVGEERFQSIDMHSISTCRCNHGHWSSPGTVRVPCCNHSAAEWIGGGPGNELPDIGTSTQ